MVIMRIQRPSMRSVFTVLKLCDPPFTCAQSQASRGHAIDSIHDSTHAISNHWTPSIGILCADDHTELCTELRYWHGAVYFPCP